VITVFDRYVAMDLETTGLDPARDRIIEIGLVRVEKGRVSQTYQSLVRPHRRLPVKIKRITGLNDEILYGAPELPEVLPEILKFIGEDNILGHNAVFDCRFIESAAASLITNTIYDTLELSRIVLPGAPGYGLAELCQLLGVEVAVSHRAMEDAMAAHLLCEALINRCKGLDAKRLAHLAALLTRAASLWAPVVQSMVTGSAWSNSVAGFLKTHTPADQHRTHWTEGEKVFVESGRVVELLGQDSVLSKAITGYQVRKQQIDMAVEVSAALNEDKLLLVEAGTGTGKSMAYLVPAVLWASSGGSRVVVSTRTINLQEQLWAKDIPLLLGALGIDVPVALAKGRQNYICLRKWEMLLAERNWTPQEAFFLARILVWLGETVQGDKVELNINGLEQELWLNICGDSESCAGARCRWYPGECFVGKARRRTEAARLIITNHALLFADVKAENRVLPAYGPLILDEAHHLEHAATEQLSTVISGYELRRWSNAAGKLLTRLLSIIPPSSAGRWQDILNGARELRIQARQAADLFFGLLHASLIPSQGSENTKITRRLKGDMLHIDATLPLAEFENLLFSMRSLLNALRELRELILSWLLLDNIWEARAEETEKAIIAGESMAAMINFNFSCADENYVYWVEAAGGQGSLDISLHSTPVKVDQAIYCSLFKDRKPVVMTSATLTVNGGFQHYMDGVGLGMAEQDRLSLKVADSPFQFEEQSLLCVVSGIPQQGESPEEGYVGAVVSVLTDLIFAMGGRTLVLFTSHRVLRETYREMKLKLEEEDVCLLGHNIDGGRWRLVEEFKNTARAVLFGASSFWEGVDIPGESLSCVVIVKLPFQSPAVPVTEARLEYLDSRGINPFYNYSLPQAVIRFKQGFGRLIRTEKDRGAVVILDSRLLSKRYGRLFLNSLPIKNHFRGDSGMVTKKVVSWLSNS
jgi:ATP-dependent DNA helicase DinG